MSNFEHTYSKYVNMTNFFLGGGEPWVKDAIRYVINLFKNFYFRKYNDAFQNYL